jgi:hypothetical protein
MKNAFLPLALLWAACNASPSKTPDVKPIIAAAIKQYMIAKAEGKASIDTVIVLSWDTLTPKSQIAELIQSQNSQANALTTEATRLRKIYELEVQKAQAYKAISADLGEASKGSVKRAGDAAREKLDEAKLALSKMESLNTLYKSGTLDSVTFLGYLPKVLFSAVDLKSGIVYTDSIFVMLDPKFHIIEYK